MSDSYDFPMGYRTLVLNGHRASTGLLDQTKESDTIRVDRFDFSRLQQRDQREALHLLTGGDLGDATLAFRYIALSGTIKAPSGTELDDRVEALLSAFNVEEAQRDSPATEGLAPFTFVGMTTLGTAPGATAHPDGISGHYYVPEKFLARPAAYPIITGRRSGGDAVSFACELVCADPRRFAVTASSIVLNSGNGFSTNCPNWNTTQGVTVHPIVTIVTSASGSATFTLALGGKSLILDLSAVGAATIVVDMFTGRITKGGVDAANLRTSNVISYGAIPRGGGTATATNTTNVTSVTLAYSQARG